MGRFLVPQRSQVVRWRGALEGLLPPDHLARFVWHVVSTLDFRDLEAGYRSVQGRPGRSPDHPRLVAALWVYGMTQRLETAAAIARACRLRDDFRWLAGGWCPSDQTLLNLLTLAPAGLGAIWGQVLGAMHRAGHIDLNVLVEDGTKLRANASPRSFPPAPEIADIIQDLERQLAAKLQAGGEPPSARSSQAEVRALERRLARAKQAAAELAQRRERRPPDPAAPSGRQAIDPSISETSPASGPLLPKFGRAAFSHDAERDVLVCPAGESLPFIGIYREPPRSPFRLYRARRTVCPGCRLKAECTAAPRRSVKIPVEPPTPSAGPAAAPANPPPAREAPGEAPAPLAAPPDAPPSGPRASLTEPEAVMMRATSVKRWEPSYTADLTVTRPGLIVHQFLTKTPTDFHPFRHALPAVLSTLGRPEAWVGDGHYSTQENVLLAHRAGVVLYAPLPDSDTDAPPVPVPGATTSAAAAAPDPGRPRKFCSRDFRPAPDKEALICPAGEELRLIGIYAGEYRDHYRIYGRAHCGACALKPQCTEDRGRRVRLPVPPTGQPPSEPHATPSTGPPRPSRQGPGEVTHLVEALAARMRELGDRIQTFRRTTIEPVNAQLKQHGLGRFHVHGLARCSTVLMLACIAHNLMKWKARESARALSALA